MASIYLNCDSSMAGHLHGQTQKVRVITEAWFLGFGYCLACPSDMLESTKANSKARDFLCPSCGSPYELKSSAKRLGVRVVDGNFKTMIARIQADEAPNLVLLRYNSEWKIRDVTALHSLFLTTSVVEARKPLSVLAKRAGWQGCNLRLDRIAADGLIPLVRDGIITAPQEVRRLYNQSAQLREIKPKIRGWVTLVLNAVRRLGRPEFQLSEIYSFEGMMHEAYPENSHIREKIRQQLQLLRDLGYLEFLGNGTYRVIRQSLAETPAAKFASR